MVKRQWRLWAYLASKINTARMYLNILKGSMHISQAGARRGRAAFNKDGCAYHTAHVDLTSVRFRPSS